MGTPADPAWMMGMPHPKSLVGTNPQTAELASLWTTTMERVVASSSSSADARMQLASAQPLVPQPVAHAPEVAPNEHVLLDPHMPSPHHFVFPPHPAPAAAAAAAAGPEQAVPPLHPVHAHPPPPQLLLVQPPAADSAAQRMLYYSHPAQPYNVNHAGGVAELLYPGHAVLARQPPPPPPQSVAALQQQQRQFLQQQVVAPDKTSLDVRKSAATSSLVPQPLPLSALTKQLKGGRLLPPLLPPPPLPSPDPSSHLSRARRRMHAQNQAMLDLFHQGYTRQEVGRRARAFARRPRSSSRKKPCPLPPRAHARACAPRHRSPSIWTCITRRSRGVLSSWASARRNRRRVKGCRTRKEGMW